MVLAAAAVFGHYAYTARKKFGGLSGDLAGWFLQRAEYWMLAALVLCQYGEALL
jgi:adenosylcobinamide-GDP ribazoletransferase